MPVPVDFTSDVVHFPARAKRLEVIEESALESDFIRDKARLVFAKFSDLDEVSYVIMAFFQITIDIYQTI